MIKPSIRIVRLLSAGLLFPWFATTGSSADTSVTLAWDSVSPVHNAAFYKVHYGTRSRTYTETVDTGNMTTCTVAALTPNQTYYFAVTASDILGNASEYSDELIIDRMPPSISGLDDLVEVITEQSVVRLPDLTKIATISDDVSPHDAITTSQTPAGGTVIGQGDTTVIVEARDGSGNIARQVITYRVQQPQGNPLLSNDPDGDGLSNVDEYIAGSDATDAQSFFSVSLKTTDGIPSVCVTGLDFSSADSANRLAILEYCTNLTQNTWTTVRTGAVDELAATPIHTIAPDAARCRFYRMRIVLP